MTKCKYYNLSMPLNISDNSDLCIAALT